MLDGIKVKKRVFHTTDKNLHNYTNWKFENKYIWDEFYYAASSNLVWISNFFKLGSESILGTLIDTNLVTKVYTDKIVDKTLLGIPISYKNNVTN